MACRLRNQLYLMISSFSIIPPLITIYQPFSSPFNIFSWFGQIMPFDSNSTYRLYNSKTSMFPSPRSSLSSFRDYYQHSSENSAWENKLEDSIDIGFRNFQVSKLLEKIDLRMHHKLYWNLFYSFKRIAIQNIHDERTMAAR